MTLQAVSGVWSFMSHQFLKKQWESIVGRLPVTHRKSSGMGLAPSHIDSNTTQQGEWCFSVLLTPVISCTGLSVPVLPLTLSAQ